MRILHVSTNDTFGGAALSAVRLVNSIDALGESSASLLVRDKFSSNDLIYSVPRYTRFKSKALSVLSRSTISFFGGNLSTLPIGTTKLSEYVKALNFDIVHLHWINACFVDLDDLVNLKVPVVWTAHDAWPFQLFQHLPGKMNFPFSYWIARKMEIIQDLNASGRLHFICPSFHLCDFARSLGWSNLNVIPNQIDPIPADFIRDGNSSGKIGFITASSKNDPNKGLEKLMLIATAKPELSFSVLGVNGFKSVDNITYVPFTKDRVALFKFISGLDKLMVLSEYENLPGVAVEALQCGVPVIGFDYNPGLSELVSLTGSGRCYASLNDLILGLTDVPPHDPKRASAFLDECLMSSRRHMQFYHGLL